MSKGNKIILFTLSITSILWILSKSGINEIVDYPILSINQIAALLGAQLFAWSMLLSARLPFIESLFNGLDKVYRVHRKTSEYGFVLILMHPIFLAINRPERVIETFLPVNGQPAMSLGVISFWLFVYIVISTLFIKELKLKYHVWKYLHKLINVPMIVALIHVILVKSDKSLFLPLGIWMYIFMGVGVLAGLYKLLLYKYISPHYKYNIKSIQKKKDLYDIIMTPDDNRLQFAAGQYVYVSFLSEDVSSESHPFCIASSPDNSEIRLVIKELGDFTRTLDKLKKTDQALLYGPHGRISAKYYLDDKDAVFIAGGIGIAPFLAMFKSESTDKQRLTTLYYCTKYKSEAYFNEELTKIANTDERLSYINHCSREGAGHLNIGNVVKELGNPQQTRFYLCASGSMMQEIKSKLIQLGIEKQNIILEDFDMI